MGDNYYEEQDGYYNGGNDSNEYAGMGHADDNYYGDY